MKKYIIPTISTLITLGLYYWLCYIIGGMEEHSWYVVATIPLIVASLIIAGIFSIRSWVKLLPDELWI